MTLFLKKSAPFALCLALAACDVSKNLEMVGVTSSGAWLKTVKVSSSNDMNFVENKEHPQDSGSSPAKIAIVFSNDDALKDSLKKITGPAFFQQMNDLKAKNGNSIYIVTSEIVASNAIDIDVHPKDNDSNGKKVYDNAKFIVLYAEYRTPGDHVYELPNNSVVSLTFNRNDVSIQQQP